MKTTFTGNRQFDLISTDNGWVAQSKEDWQRENKCLLINSVKLGWFIGLGYWKDEYKEPFFGYAHNILLPFIRIQFGILTAAKDSGVTIVPIEPLRDLNNNPLTAPFQTICTDGQLESRNH